MTDPQHTEGRWRAGKFAGKLLVDALQKDATKKVAEVSTVRDEAESNARLIAASPTQSEALRAIHALASGNPTPARRYAEKHGIDDPFEKDDPGMPRASTLIRRISEHALAKSE